MAEPAAGSFPSRSFTGVGHKGVGCNRSDRDDRDVRADPPQPSGAGPTTERTSGAAEHRSFREARWEAALQGTPCFGVTYPANGSSQEGLLPAITGHGYSTLWQVPRSDRRCADRDQVGVNPHQ